MPSGGCGAACHEPGFRGDVVALRLRCECVVDICAGVCWRPAVGLWAGLSPACEWHVDDEEARFMFCAECVPKFKAVRDAWRIIRGVELVTAVSGPGVAVVDCPGCGVPVLEAPAVGRLLQVESHPLGVWLPLDGGRRMSVREALDGVGGHHEHRCPPPGQVALFGGGV